jgi:ribonuclease J
MRLRIHRGAAEIGGNCVELQSGPSSILIDLGLPLNAEGPEPSLLPAVRGLTDGSNPNLAGIVLSHPHGDHYGLAGLVHPDIPVFIGTHARKLLMASARFMRLPLQPSMIRTYANRAAFEIGGFKVTPFLTDHSAFDAYSLLIEVNGKRVFYSGDLRAHGRKARLVDDLIADPPSDIDVLILEGTTISRPDTKRAQTEADLENDILAAIHKATGLVLTTFSPQNIDRFVSVFRATKRAGRTFIADVYLAHLVDDLALSSLPGARSEAFRVYLPSRQRQRIISDHAFSLVEQYRGARIFDEEIARHPNRFVMLFRESMMADLDRIEPSNATLLYSLWPGYLEKNNLRAWCTERQIDLQVHHTSGHADRETLLRLAQALKPRQVVPIHTDDPHVMKTLIPNTRVVRDGEWIDV